MIKLAEDQRIQTLENWVQVTSRPGFQSNVDPAAVELKEIIGVYGLPSQVRCGLSNCHTPHNNGFLVSLSHGLSTNIGNVCGAKRFGKSFRDAHRNYRRDLRRSLQADLVDEAKRKIPEYRETLNRLLNDEYGAKWAYNCSLPLRQRSKHLPDRVSLEVMRMTRVRNGTIFIERRLTENERESIGQNVASGAKSDQTYIRERVATLDGLQALFQENSLRELIVNDLSVELNRLESAETATLSDKKLSDLSKLSADIQNRIGRAKSTLPLYLSLLRKSNLLRLEVLVENSDERRLLRDFANTLPP